jgi:two-component system chemotaxis sensor kinase CheA
VIADVAQEIAALRRTGSSAAPADPPRRSPVGSPEVPTPTRDATGADAAPADPATSDSQLRTLTELRGQLGPGEGGGEIRQVIDALDRQARQFWDLASDLKAQVSSLASVALEGTFRRLQRPVRDAARHAGKLVTLDVSGGEIRVDHAITERLYAPLLHLVRNAVSHGIETPGVRERHGKSRTGSVRVRAALREGDLVLVVEDDGAGLDIAAIRAKATSLGWVDPQHVPTRAELIPLIFRAGFSTQADVTELAGRGVGMDVVAREIEALDGVIDVESRDGSGTRIRLSIPLNTGDASTVRIVPGDATRTVSDMPRRRSG